MGIEHATPVILLMLFLMVVPVLYYIKKAREGKEYYVRRIAGVDAIDEAIGRTAEMGRPLAFSNFRIASLVFGPAIPSGEPAL